MKPIRTCIVCRNKFDKSKLTKISKDKNGSFIINGQDGRGAYICNKNECLEKLVSKKVLNKTFKKDVPQVIYDKIINEVNKNEQREN